MMIRTLEDRSFGKERDFGLVDAAIASGCRGDEDAAHKKAEPPEMMIRRSHYIYCSTRPLALNWRSS